MGPWMHGWDGWGWMLGWHLLGWLLLVAVVTAVVIALVRRPRHDGADRGADDPRRILAERYARGEIDTEEYRERRNELS